jgi:hyperosmotically inducible periplasmic protein
MKGSAISRLICGLLLALTVMSFTACKGKNKDGEIQTAFNSKVQTDPNLAGVTASVIDGTVTLTGSCADENCRTNAEKTVKDIDGVKKVVNNIQIAQVQVTDDAPLRSSAEQVIANYSGVQADVNAGVITLRGTIDNREKLQQLMMDLNALRPQRIDNQLVIKNK